MQAGPTTPEEKSINEFLARHLVPMLIAFEDGSEWVLSSFVVETEFGWVLVTAGHVLHDIERKVEQSSIKISHLVDHFGDHAKFEHTLPFDFEGSPKFHGNTDEELKELDIGFVYIGGRDHNTVLQLLKNDVQAIKRGAWRGLPPGEPFLFFLTGIPAETVKKISENQTELGAAVIPLRLLDGRPAGFEKTKGKRYYFEATLTAVEDIKGMSGGPILALYRGEGDQVRYWLHSIQGGWVRSKKCVATYPIRDVLREAERVAKAARDKLESAR